MTAPNKTIIFQNKFVKTVCKSVKGTPRKCSCKKPRRSDEAPDS